LDSVLGIFLDFDKDFINCPKPIYGINKEVDKYIDFKRSRRELSVERKN
jgi:hypothetical protein